MSSIQNYKKKNHELSFTKKCILFANIQNETDKILLNSFYFLPIVKLYTATIKQESFNYSKIKGPLFLFQDKKQENYFLRIYDKNDYSLKFSLEINPETKKNYIKVEKNFYCFSLKLGCIGFKFASTEDAETFKKIFDNGKVDKSTQEEYEQYKQFPLKDSDSMFLDVIDNLIEQYNKTYSIITLGEQLDQSFHQVAEYLIFSGFLELSQLLSNIEFDYEDNVYNIYIDKKYNIKLFRKMFYYYDKNNLYPLRPVVHDFLNIYDNYIYVELLVGHLMNNFKEQIEIYKKRKENNLKEKSRQTKKDYLAGGEGIEEDMNEDYDPRDTGNSIGRFFSGLNPFK